MWLALVGYCLFFQGGPFGCHGGERVAFVLEWEGVDSALGPIPPTVAVAETRFVRVPGPDGPPPRSRLESARLIAVPGSRYDCAVPMLCPPLQQGLLVWVLLKLPYSYYYDWEYRFTVYTPGYVAATVYPEGSSNVAEPVSKPSLLRLRSAYSPATYRDTDWAGLEMRTGPNGEQLYVIRLKKLGADVPETELLTFWSQYASVYDALPRGRLMAMLRGRCLLGTGEGERRVLAEAVGQQVEFYASGIGDTWPFAWEKIHSLRQIQAWAAADGRRSSTGAPGPASTRPS